jgi:cytochrome c
MKILFVAAAAIGSLFTGPGALALDELHKKYSCTSCHADDRKLVGPSYRDVADKYRDEYQKDAPAMIAKLSAKIKKGGAGVWGVVPMTPHGHVPDADVAKMAKSVLDLPPRKKR